MTLKNPKCVIAKSGLSISIIFASKHLRYKRIIKLDRYKLGIGIGTAKSMIDSRGVSVAGAAGAIFSLALSLFYVATQLLEWLGWLGSGGGPHSVSAASGLLWLLIPSLLLGPAYLLLIASLTAAAPQSRKAFGMMALACAAVYAALTGSVYFVQLAIVVPRLAVNHDLGSLEALRFTPFVSPLYAVDILGYAFMSISAGFASAALPHLAGTRTARLLLIAIAALLPFLIGQMFLTSLIWASATWGVSFPLAMAVLARIFINSLNEQRTKPP